MQDFHPECAVCPYDWSERYCRKEGGKGPKNCPSLRHKALKERSLELLRADPALMNFATQASLQESAGYSGREKGYANIKPAKPRIQEIVEFAKRMEYHRLGMAFCIGLRKEAEVVHKIFTDNGLELVSICCKAGRTPKEAIGLTQADHVDPSQEKETMCNPVLQALLANEHDVELNVLMGLCVGHDSLFIKHAEAPVTVLAVKDRLLGHAPLTAVYQYDAYYRNLKCPFA